MKDNGIETKVKGIKCILDFWLTTNQIKEFLMLASLLHLMRAITRAHASTRAISLMRVKNSIHHFCFWHLLSGTLERRKWKKEQEHQIKQVIILL